MLEENGASGQKLTVSELTRHSGGRGAGPRTEFALTGRALCDQANDRVLAALTDEDRELAFISSLDVGLRKCDRTCMNLYAEMRGLVGTKLDLALTVVNLIGAPADRARAAVSAYNRAAELPDDELYRLSLESCNAIRRKQGKRPLIEPEEVPSATSP